VRGVILRPTYFRQNGKKQSYQELEKRKMQSLVRRKHGVALTEESDIGFGKGKVNSLLRRARR